jgi:murein L,D-transpeptidase YafK
MEAKSRLLLVALVWSVFGSGCVTAQGLYKGEALPDKCVVDRIEVYKDKHVLEAWSKDELLKVYKIVIGKGRKGPKRYEGDNRTPEGRYRIDSRHRSKKFHRFLHLSYPNKSDRKGFRKDRKDGSVPAGAGIGGAVGIHGEKKGKEWLPHKLVDWTQGCIALDNDEIEELFRMVKKNADVIIHP